MSQALTKFNPKSFADYTKANRPALQQSACSQVRENSKALQRLYRMVLNTVGTSESLLKCSNESIFRAMMQAAEVGLEPSSVLGECYLVPFGQECRLIIGYRGYIALARRSGLINSIQAAVVYHGDEFEVIRGLNPVLAHKPAWNSADAAKLTHAYAIARIKGADAEFDVMTRAEIEAIRKRSKAKDNGPWVTDYAEMAKKTVIRRLMKLLPMSIELARASEIDTTNDDDFIEGTILLTPSSSDPIDDDITDLADEVDMVVESPAVAAMSR
jgi:recombination protein RecT